MPCTYDPPSGPSADEIEQRKVARITKGIACASLTFIAKMYEGDSDPLNTFLKAIDWKEIGISKKEVIAWWKNHQREDRERKAREQREKQKAEAEFAANLTKKQAELRKAVGTLTDTELAHMGLIRLRPRKVFEGWACENSPTKYCQYEPEHEYCIICGLPYERK